MANKGPAEYIIKLGTDIDNRGLNQIMDFFNTFRKSSLGATAAIVGATTALYKFIETTTKQEFELKKLAKTQGISIEQATKQKAVLDAMGKTLEEVRKDDKLNKTYQELTKINKELELPSASGTIKKIEDLRQSFWQFKSAVGLTVTAIGRQLLINLEAPIRRITGGMNKISEWVRTNLNNISVRVTSVLTAFAKGIVGIAETFGKIFKWINQLPSGIKAIAGAIGVVALALTAGPIGKILTAITAIGTLIHDYENYQWNKQNEKETKFWAADNEKGWTKDKSKAITDASGNPIAYKVPLFLEPAWEGYEENGILGVADALGNKLMEGIGNFDAKDAGENFGKFIVEIFDKITATVQDAASGKSVGGILGAGIKLGEKIFEFLGTAIKTIAPTGAEIGAFVNSIFTQVGLFLSSGAGGMGTIPGTLLEGALTVASGILDFIIAGLNELTKVDDKTKKTGIETFVVGLFDFLKTAISELGTKITGGEDGFDLETTLSGIGERIGDIIGSLIVISTDFLGTFVNEALKWLSDGENLKKLTDIGTKILSAILKGLTNIWDAIMRKLFGDRWVGAGERRETVSDVADKFVDPETGEVLTTVEGESGQEYTLQGAMDYASENTRAAEVEFGIRNATDIEAYRKGFYKSIGADELSRGLGSSKDFVGDIARLFGMKYDPSTLSFYGGKDGNQYIGDENSFALFNEISNLNFAEDIDSFNKAFAQVNELMKELGMSGFDTESAEKEGYLSAQKAAEKLAQSEAEAANQASSLSSDLKALAGAASSAKTALLSLSFSSEGETTQALGGRFDKRQGVTVGEDGTEYIIPITKPARAASLMKQMFSEMGGAAASKIFSDLGLGSGGSSVSSVASAMSGMTMANTYNISAPVTINVNSSGADAKEIGSNVYSIAERRLIANLTGVCG